MSWKYISSKKINAIFSNNFIAVMIVLSAAAIIISNYYISKVNVEEIHKIIREYEYNKTWWEENYKIMLEIQRDQMNSYINDLNKTNPEYLDSIRSKIDPEYRISKTLTQEEIEILQNTSPVMWDENADFSIVEFSDFECLHCIDFHKENNIWEILSENNNWNYIFKNMINNNNSNAKIASKYWKCIEKNWTKELYFDFLNYMFDEENIDKIDLFIDENNLSKEEIEVCINQENTIIELEREFWQWIYLWITQTPSFVLINNKSWETFLIEWKINKEELLKNLENFAK